MGGDQNTVHLLRGETVSSWPLMDKTAVAEALVHEIALALKTSSHENH
jgi:hypothetical protein